MIYDAIIIGAGQAGLAIGYHLQKTGLLFLILEAGDELGGSWPHYYDSLLLNTPARYSSLPGLPFPGHPDHYPQRDEVVTYLRSYAAHFDLPIVTGAQVTKVERRGQLFHLTTGGKDSYETHTVVAATGFFGQPYLPDLPGQAQYRGQLLHMATYRSPEPFRRQRIVIVGGANAALQIGVELAQVAHVTLATRYPIRYMPQRILGRDVHFWLKVTGLDRSQWLGDQSTPVYDSGKYRRAIAAGQPDRKPMFKHFTEDGVVWSDGSHEAVDAVIFATGYRPNLTYLAGLGALDEAGRVLQQGGVSMTVPGLYYVGLPRQRNAASATLRGVGADAKVVVAHLRRYGPVQLRRGGRPAIPMIVIPQRPEWVARGSELIGLISLTAVAFKQQLAAHRVAAPRLAGEALAHAFLVGAGFLGFGHAAKLYAHS
jgi:putative flavoprotein involved in K+ transport